MIEKLLHKLFEEKHDFYDYMDLYRESTDSTMKTTIKGIAEQEMHHYKEIYDLVFKDNGSRTWTPTEKAMCWQAKEWYKEMDEVLRAKD